MECSCRESEKGEFLCVMLMGTKAYPGMKVLLQNATAFLGDT